MKKVKILTLLTIIISLILLTNAFAQEGPPRGGMGRPAKGKIGMPHKGGGRHEWSWWHNDKIIEELDLSDKQLEKLEKIKNNTKKKMIKLGADMETRNIDLMEAFGDSDFSESKIKKLINEIADLKAEMYKVGVLARLDGAKVLTKDQRKKLKSLKMKRGNWKKNKSKKR